MKVPCVFHLWSLLLLVAGISAFTTAPSRAPPRVSCRPAKAPPQRRHPYILPLRPSNSHLASSNNDNDSSMIPNESDQAILGALGSVCALLVLISEYVLNTTGCGLPAGPLGLIGLAEGLSYLGVVGIVAISLVAKVKTGAGLPAGPGGLLGAAEGLSYLALVAGLVVLVLQVTNYGYIPNAVPMEGGMCS